MLRIYHILPATHTTTPVIIFRKMYMLESRNFLSAQARIECEGVSPEHVPADEEEERARCRPTVGEEIAVRWTTIRRLDGVVVHEVVPALAAKPVGFSYVTRKTRDRTHPVDMSTSISMALGKVE